MKATCPHCGGHYEVDEPGGYACPSCGQAFEVKAPPRQAALKVSRPKADSPNAAKPRPKLKITGQPSRTETTHTCPWCMTKIPGTRTHDTWACPACTRLYIVKDGTRTERVYRTSNNLDAGIPRKQIVASVIIFIALFIILFIFALANLKDL